MNEKNTNLILKKHLKLDATHVDLYRRIRLSAMFALLQQSAVEHTVLLGCGRDKTLDRGLLWIVTHYSAWITRMPVYDEEITISTWAGKAMHVFFPRFWRITDSAGQTLMEVSSLWMLLDAGERRIVFPEKYDISIPHASVPDQPPLPPRFRMPEEYSEEVRFTVPLSYVDMNGHMNNTRYFDVVQDVLPLELYRRELRHVTMEYVSEILLKQDLRIRYLLSDNEAMVTGLTDKLSFRMKLEYEPDSSAEETAPAEGLI